MLIITRSDNPRWIISSRIEATWTHRRTHTFTFYLIPNLCIDDMNSFLNLHWILKWADFWEYSYSGNTSECVE